MTTLLEAVRRNAAEVSASGFYVTAASALGHVSLSRVKDGRSVVFLQGHEAEQVIMDARRLWNELEEVTMDECLEHRMHHYLELAMEDEA